MVPFLDDWQAFDGRSDVWATTQECLDVLAGDWEEHAIMLANFFSFLDREAGGSRAADMENFIVLGSGMPEGRTVWVLRRHRVTGDGTLWNASTGMGYNVLDELCPLRDVGCLVSDKNIWANLQPTGAPWKVRFNLAAGADWMPFWSASFPLRELPSLQADVPQYPRTRREFVTVLEAEIGEALKQEFRYLRKKRFHTRLNQSVARQLKPLLEGFERVRLASGGAFGLPINEAEHLEALARVSATSTIFGFPINVPFTDVGAVVRAVRATNVHGNEDERVQFAIAVLVVPYTNDVCSVWVYAVNMVPK